MRALPSPTALARAVTALLLGAGAAAWLLAPEGAPLEPARAAAAEGSASPPAPQARPAATSLNAQNALLAPAFEPWRAGQVRRYAFRYQAALGGQGGEGDGDEGPGGDGGQALEVRAAGFVIQTCYAVDAQGVTLGERWEPLELAFPGDTRAVHTGLHAELACELLVRTDPRGVVQGLALPARASQPARDLLRALAALPRLARPAHPAQAGLAESGLAQAGLAQSDPAQSDPTRAGPAESGLAESGLAESGLAESGLAESGPAQAGLAQSDPALTVLSSTGPVWRAEGFDPTGPCRDEYRLLERTPDGLLRVARQRAFLGLRGQPPAPGVVTAAGGALLTLDAAGDLLRLELREQLTVRAPGSERPLVLSTHATLERSGPPSAAAHEDLPAALAHAEATLGGAAAWAEGAAPPAASPIESAPPPALEALLAEAQRLGPEGLSRADGPRLFFQLAARLRQDGPAVARARELLTRGALDPAVGALLLDALGEARTPDTRAALVALTQVALPLELVPNLYLALGGQEPLGEVLAAVRDGRASRDPTRAAWAIHGQGLLAAHAPASTADALAAELEQALARGADPTSELATLEALGNAGRARSIAPLTARARSEADPQLRAAAVWALRAHAADPAVREALLAARLDPDPQVRASAVRALAEGKGEAGAGALPPLLETLAADEHPEVRLHALEALAARSEQPDQIRAALERAAIADPDPAIRDAARLALED